MYDYNSFMYNRLPEKSYAAKGALEIAAEAREREKRLALMAVQFKAEEEQILNPKPGFLSVVFASLFSIK